MSLLLSIKTNSIVVKAALLVGAVFFISGQSLAFENYQDLIKKAYRLAEQKERGQALGLLNVASKREGSVKSLNQIRQAASQISEIFYSDKAQQEFEMAISLYADAPTKAIEHLNGAIKLEEDNALITSLLVRAYVRQSECGSAKRVVAATKDHFLLSENFLIAKMQTSVCAGELGDYKKIRLTVDVAKSEHKLSWFGLDLEAAGREQNFSQVKEIAASIIKLEKIYPEIFYWNAIKAKIDLKDKNPTGSAVIEDLNKKYFDTCKSLSSKILRNHLEDAFFCSHISDVEQNLKK